MDGTKQTGQKQTKTEINGKNKLKQTEKDKKKQTEVDRIRQNWTETNRNRLIKIETD